jgi:hypothetical protein
MDSSTRGVLIGLGSIIAVCGAGFSPDDGNGSMEVMLLTVLFMIIAAVVFRLTFKNAP